MNGHPQQPPNVASPPELTHAIKQATSWQELMHLHKAYRQAMNPIHLSAALTHLAHLYHAGQRAPPPPPPAAAAASHTQQYRSGGSRTISSGGDGAPRSAGLPPQAHPLAYALLFDSGAVMHLFENRQVANCLWAAAKLGLSPPAVWLARSLAMARHTCAKGTPQQLANTLYAVACRPEWLDGLQARGVWLDTMLTACHAKVLQFQPQELSNLLWAAATLHAHRPLLASDAPAAGTTGRRSSRSPSDSSSSSGGGGRAGGGGHVSSVGMVKALSAALHAACARADELNAQEACNVLWAASKLCARWSPGRGSADTAIGSKTKRRSAGGHLLHASEGMSHHASLASHSSSDDMNDPDQSTARDQVWGAATAGPRSQCASPLLPPLPPAQVAALWSRVQAVAAQGQLSHQGLSAALLSLPALGVCPSHDQLRALLHATSHLLPSCPPRELSNVLLGLAYLGHRPPPTWFAHWQARMVHVAASTATAPHHLATSVWAMARLRMPPSRALAAQLLLSSAGQLHAMTGVELLMLGNALAQLRIQPAVVSQDMISGMLGRSALSGGDALRLRWTGRSFACGVSAQLSWLSLPLLAHRCPTPFLLHTPCLLHTRAVGLAAAVSSRATRPPAHLVC
jgi:uncharacterized membrane protein YgcG